MRIVPSARIRSFTLNASSVLEERCRRFLLAHFFAPLETPARLTSFEIHDCLLLPPGHVNRLFPPELDKTAAVPPRPKLSQLYRQLYGAEPVNGSALKAVGTATAYLFRAIVQGLADRRLYTIARSPRSERNSLLEIEFSVPDADIESACATYTNFLSHVLERDVHLDISPTEFTWSAPAYRFVNPKKPDMRCGAFGFVKKELLNALWPEHGPSMPSNICMTGISVESLVQQAYY